jgi:hypothetical protein
VPRTFTRVQQQQHEALEHILGRYGFILIGRGGMGCV